MLVTCLLLEAKSVIRALMLINLERPLNLDVGCAEPRLLLLAAQVADLACRAALQNQRFRAINVARLSRVFSLRIPNSLYSDNFDWAPDWPLVLSSGFLFKKSDSVSRSDATRSTVAQLLEGCGGFSVWWDTSITERLLDVAVEPLSVRDCASRNTVQSRNACVTESLDSATRRESSRFSYAKWICRTERPQSLRSDIALNAWPSAVPQRRSTPSLRWVDKKVLVPSRSDESRSTVKNKEYSHRKLSYDIRIRDPSKLDTYLCMHNYKRYFVNSVVERLWDELICIYPITVRRILRFSRYERFWIHTDTRISTL